LNERGEKISRLQDNTSQLENQAKSFADMARELREKEERKKWWEF